jgi:sugar phosphate isomerase/epimerase
MRELRRRAIRLTAAALTGAAVLASAGAAQAQRPETTGDGIPTGQMGVQMFNYGGYISNGGNTGAASPITGVSAGCVAGTPDATTTACRMERVERLFAFLQSKGVTNIELFGHATFPASSDIPGLQAYRALLDKYGLHAGGWHGDMSEANWDVRVNAAKILGADYIGSGGQPAPGIGSYANTLATAQALNRLGKRSVEAGLGPAYTHNHQNEFRTQYVHNGVLTTAFDILLAESDPRYSAAELDVFWSSDAFQDTTGTQSAALINKWFTPAAGQTPAASRIQLLHVKDGINVDETANGNPRAAGTGELDFRPIFAAAKGKVRYYHAEQDGGTLTDSDTSFTNLKGINTQVVPALLALPPAFQSVRAGELSPVVPVLVQNSGDAPLNITNVTVQQNALDAPSSADFQIVSQNCTVAGGGGPLAPGQPTADPVVPRGTCLVNVVYRPQRADVTSVARLQFTSNSDAATNSVLLAAKSLQGAVQSVGGSVPTMLGLSIPAAASFGTFTPGVARDYLVTMGAIVTHTASGAALSVTDPSSTATGYLVNGSTALPSALNIRAQNASTSAAFAPLSVTAGEPLALLSYAGPVSNDAVTIGFRQSIAATDALLAGTYSKTLTFELASTTP